MATRRKASPKKPVRPSSPKKKAKKSRTKAAAKKAAPKKAAPKKAAPKKAAKKAAPKKAAPKKAAPKKAAPRAQAAAPTKRPERAAASRPAIGPQDVRILVVDDEPEVLNLLVPHLGRLGYRISEAEDGDEALEKILTERPNIVLLDVMMPGLNGWEICQYVRDRPELDQVRIIMATGIGSETNAATAPIYGADAYIDKPFRLEDVDRAVLELVERMPGYAH